MNDRALTATPNRRAFARRARLAAGGLAMGLCLAPSFGGLNAQAPLDPAAAEVSRLEDERARLAEIAAAADVGEARVSELRDEITRLRDDRAELNGRLIETANLVRRLEDDVTASEVESDRLSARILEARASLDARRVSLAQTLRAMQTLGANPPPAVFAAPGDALDAIRAATILGTVMPALKEEADALKSGLRRLAALTEAQDDAHARLIVRLTELAQERVRTELLIEEKRRGLRTSEKTLADAQSRAETLAAEAGSLRELIATMETEIAVARIAAQSAEAARTERNAELERLAALNTARLEPAIPFAAALGLSPRPASGVTTLDWGDEDGFGGRSQGLTIVTRTGAQVVSPADAWVVYAGPYRSYGQLVILNAGDDHHVLLAGMDRIDVELGQFVLAGEPVALMGGRLSASASLAPQSTQPSLYVEFRRSGRAVDPTPWWNDEAESRKVRG